LVPPRGAIACLRATVVVLACAAVVPAHAQGKPDSRSLDTMLRNAPPRGDDARMINANLPELVHMRLSQLEEDLNVMPAQMPLWKTYRAKVLAMLDDARRDTRVLASESTAPKRFDALSDMARNRLTAVEEIVDAGKALYASLTPDQKSVADRRLALPLATLTGNDAGSDLRLQPRPPKDPPK
jgi:hypothetical protein